jgi:glycosyl transferase family 25
MTEKVLDLTIIVINLDRDVERLNYIKDQLDKQGLSFIRHPALTGPQTLNLYAEQFRDCSLKAGEIGCWGSHIQIAKMIENGDYKSPALVIEDDVELPPNLYDLLNSILKEAPETWDIIRLSNQSKFKFKTMRDLIGQYKLIQYSRIPGGTGASLISKKGASKIARLKPSVLAIDQHFKKSWLTDLITFGVFPAPILPDRLASSINEINTDISQSSRLRISRIQRQIFYLKNWKAFITFYFK